MGQRLHTQTNLSLEADKSFDTEKSSEMLFLEMI
jgi:hypothetical protein